MIQLGSYEPIKIHTPSQCLALLLAGGYVAPYVLTKEVHLISNHCQSLSNNG
jgi:hypothetical protein